MLKKGIYVLPSMFTLGNLAMGFLSIISASTGHYTPAAWFIVSAGVFDALDGRIARLTKTTSNFGVELDSLCDIVSFGIAPGFLIYKFVLFKYGKWGIIISLLYVIAAALRLARFNSMTLKDEEDKYFFKGLPTPAAANIITSFVLIDNLIDNNITKKIIPLIMKKFYVLYNLLPLLILLVAYAMVSNISYMSLKNLKLGKAKTFREIILLCIGIALIFRYPENMLFIIFLLYFLSGILDIFKKISKMSQKIKKIKKLD